MDFRENEEARALAARLDDLCARADSGELGVTVFMSPRELAFTKKYLAAKGAAVCFFGGYPQAERQRAYILPDYMSELSECDGDTDIEERLSQFGYSSSVFALRICGSGYRRLSHRDFLGSLLGLGIERSVLGDILLLGDGDREALLLCDSNISEFIEKELCYVANDKVKVRGAELEDIQIPPRRTQPISDTVASPRLDAVVAALCNLSRDKARAAVVSGLVEIDFESEERPDRLLSGGATVSVRGFGRYRVISVSDKTKKGRYRLVAEKYV